jgi:sulfide:quinone oxidoreductase
MSPKPSPPHIIIAGGGVAAIEAMLALRALAGRRPAITLLSAETELAPPATAVAAPFGFGPPAPLPIGPLAERHGVRVRPGMLAAVDVPLRAAIVDDDRRLDYDHLLVAVGARRGAAIGGAVTFRGPADAPSVEAVLDDLAADRASSLAVAVSSSDVWSLPAYELAIMAAVELRSRGVAEPRITLVTPEPIALAVFGSTAADAVAELLHRRGIELRTATTPRSVQPGVLRTSDGDVQADRVIALPESVGPFLPGLPHDERGFIPTDEHARVEGCPGVDAAGDATSFGLHQGGLAAQQADAAAETIAARLGAIATPRPFHPVLRGVLLTGGAPLYLRADLSSGDDAVTRPLVAARGSAGPRSLWWPPAKVAGRYLAPLLSTARPPSLLAAPMRDLADAPPPEEPGLDEALALALAIADEDAGEGDFAQALHALDAARGLCGGVLPKAYADKERDWLSRA